MLWDSGLCNLQMSSAMSVPTERETGRFLLRPSVGRLAAGTNSPLDQRPGAGDCNRARYAGACSCARRYTGEFQRDDKRLPVEHGGCPCSYGMRAIGPASMMREQHCTGPVPKAAETQMNRRRRDAVLSVTATRPESTAPSARRGGSDTTTASFEERRR
jgi:hypothetical protein